MGCALNQDSAGSEGNVNINVRAAFIHVLGDLIQSIGVCIAAIIIYMRVSGAGRRRTGSRGPAERRGSGWTRLRSV